MDRFLLKNCNKDTKRKSLGSCSVHEQWHVTHFLNRVSILESFCLLKDSFNIH